MMRNLFVSAILGLVLLPPALAAGTRAMSQADALYASEGAGIAAVDLYRSALQDDLDAEERLRALSMVGQILEEMQRYEEAASTFADILVNAPRGVLRDAVNLRLARCLWALDDADGAEVALQEVLTQSLDSYLSRDARFALCQIYAAGGEWTRFQPLADEIISRWPSYGNQPDFLFNYGVYLYSLGETGKAQTYFARIDSEDASWYLARCLADEGKYFKAVQEYRRLLAAWPDSDRADEAAYAIGESFYRSGQNELARRSFESFMKNSPDSEHYWAAGFRLAAIQFSKNEYARAAERADKLLAADLDSDLHERALLLRGLSLLNLGRENEARETFAELLESFPSGQSSSTAFFNLVLHYAHQENWNQVVGLADTFSEDFSGDALGDRIDLLACLALLETGKLQEAQQRLSRLLDRQRGSAVGEKALFLLTYAQYRSEQPGAIVTNYRNVARRMLPTPDPWRAKTFYLIAESYYGLGLYADSADLYRQILNDYPFSSEAAFALQGMTASYSHLGLDDRAALEREKYLLAISNEAGTDPSNALAAAGMYFNRGDHEKALELFDKFLTSGQTGPALADALYQSGECLFALSYYDDAVKRWRRVIEEFPAYTQIAEVVFKTADTLFGLQQYGEAAALFSHLYEIAPDHALAEESCFNSANCLYNQGDYSAAADAFQAYALAFPDGSRSEDAQQAIQLCFQRSGRDLLAYVRENPSSSLAAGVYWDQGINAFQDEDFALAAEHFEMVSLQYPDSDYAAEAMYYLGEARMRGGDEAGALSGFETYIASYPDGDLTPAALLRAGNILFTLGRLEESAGVFISLAMQFADDDLAPLGLFNAGLAYQQLEAWSDFLMRAEDLLRLYPEHDKVPVVRRQIAEVCLHETGEHQRSLDTWDKLLADQQIPVEEGQYFRGECFEKLGREEDALSAYDLSAEGSQGEYAFASLARLASIHEKGGRLADARNAYRRIADGSGNPEWASLAMERISLIDAEQPAESIR